MSTPAKKPPPSTPLGRRPSTDPSTSPGAPSRNARASTPPSSTNSVARARSVRTSAPLSARAAMQRTGAGASSLSTGSTTDADDDARAESATLLEELKDRLRDTELKAEQFQRQSEVLQARLDDALKEQGKLEDKLHEGEERLETFEYEKRDAARTKREMDSIYEAERSAMNREREEMSNREEELQTIIHRLKESLSQRNVTDDERRLSRTSNNTSPGIDSGHFAPPSSLNRSDSRNNSKIVLQKDKLIESLRLELAEAQIKLVETENMGGGRMHEVEKLLMETRMANARLMEDNESFQLLLSQKTLNGDFAKDHFGFVSSNADALDALEGRTATNSLADELADAGETDSENSRRLEVELKAAKDQNKALTLYINKIIERLLQHQDFEAILDQSSEFKPSATSNKDKELPPPPSEQPSMLQRAKSVVAGSGKARPRPLSQMPAAHSALTDPDTAPSIPFGLGRAQSSRKPRPQSEQLTGGGATIVNQMHRPLTGQMSPPLHGPTTPRNSQSFFAPPVAVGNPNAAARYPSGSSGHVPTVSSFSGGRSSETSSIDGVDVFTPPNNSPPRPEKATTFAGNKPRPLRLVEDAKVEDNKKNNRASWMGWAGSLVGKKEETPSESIKE